MKIQVSEISIED